MSKEIDSIVLTAHAYGIALEASLNLREDVGQGLWYIRRGETHWYNGQLITNEEKTNHYACEAFLYLGDLAAKQYFGDDSYATSDDNPAVHQVVDTLVEISPLQKGEILDTSFAIKSRRRSVLKESLLIKSLSIQDTDSIEELHRKWEASKNVHAHRGKAIIQVYDLDEIVAAVSSVDLTSTAPDMFEIDNDGEIISQTYGVLDLANKSHVKPRLSETAIPYYRKTYRDNGAAMLADALEDLRLVKQTLDSMQ